MMFSARSLFFSPFLYSAVRLALGVVFAWAGGAKLVAPRAFARVLSNYQMIPESLLAPIAIGLPLVEFFVGVGLIFDVKGSLSIAVGLLFLFLVALGFGLLNNLDMDCGCFSPEEAHAQNSLSKALLRDLGLVMSALYLFFWRRVRARKRGVVEVQV